MKFLFRKSKSVGFVELVAGDIPAATAEDVEAAVDAACKALARNKGRDWALASGAFRAKYLRAIAAKIAFTGSTATGSKIMAAASQIVKPISLELGGKRPIVVFEDVDLDKGKHCSRVFTETYQLDKKNQDFRSFGRRLQAWTSCSGGQYEKIMKMISTAKMEGTTILCGGRRPQHLKRGFFIEPAIITDVDTSMQIWREEVFGPVLCVKTFRTEEEAIELENDTHYGLGSAVISNYLERCERMTKAFEAGIVWVNCSQPCFCQAPWGGNTRSGLGRELGGWDLKLLECEASYSVYFKGTMGAVFSTFKALKFTLEDIEERKYCSLSRE